MVYVSGSHEWPLFTVVLKVYLHGTARLSALISWSSRRNALLRTLWSAPSYWCGLQRAMFMGRFSLSLWSTFLGDSFT